MQFTTVATLLFAAVASAAPSLEARQANSVRATLHAPPNGSGDCSVVSVTRILIDQLPVNQCVSETNFPPHTAVNFFDNVLTGTLKLYNSPNCDESGNHQTLAPGENSCRAVTIRSYKFIS